MDNTFLTKKRNIIIKIGTRVFISETGEIKHQRIDKLINDISTLKEKGHQIVIISSGSVGIGMSMLRYKRRPQIISKRQACASIGQPKLMNYYANKFEKKNIIISQILISADDLRNRDRHNNIKNTLHQLLKSEVIPIINENDTVSTEEITLGDNDTLSSHISNFLQPDLLIIISDEEGFFDKNPKKYSDAKLISIVDEIDKETLKKTEDIGSEMSIGGMNSKLIAINQINQLGIPVILCDQLSNFVKRKHSGTLFLAGKKKINAKKYWLTHLSDAKGSIYIDEGAEKMLLNKNSSLLTVGVMKVKNDFKKGDLVFIKNINEEIIAKGIATSSSENIINLLNNPTNEKLKEKNKIAVHKTNLIIT